MSASVEEVVNALASTHQLAAVEDPIEHSPVRQVLAASKRILAHKTIYLFIYITAAILQKLHDKFVSTDADLATIRTMAICLIGYAVFFRFSEMAAMRECDVKFYDEHLEVFIKSSKTDQFRDGAWVPIARTHSDICPVAMLERPLLDDHEQHPLDSHEQQPNSLLLEGCLKEISDSNALGKDHIQSPRELMTWCTGFSCELQQSKKLHEPASCNHR